MDDIIFNDNLFFNIIESEQGSDSWKQRRLAGVGGTAASTIMGLSYGVDRYGIKTVYNTPASLFLEYVGVLGPKEETWPMTRGKKLEPIAKLKLEEEYDIFGIDLCIQPKQEKFIFVSLDFISYDVLNFEAPLFIGEIKSPMSDKEHWQVRDGEMPLKYMPQVQLGLYASQAEFCYFVSYYTTKFTNKKDNIDSLLYTYIYPDKKYQNHMVNELRDWYYFVQMARGIIPNNFNIKKQKLNKRQKDEILDIEKMVSIRFPVLD